jgi:hypothetical protein
MIAMFGHNIYKQIITLKQNGRQQRNNPHENSFYIIIGQITYIRGST